MSALKFRCECEMQIEFDEIDPHFDKCAKMKDKYGKLFDDLQNIVDNNMKVKYGKVFEDLQRIVDNIISLKKVPRGKHQFC